VIPGTVAVGFLHPGHYAACFASSLIDLLFFDAANGQRIVSHPHGTLGKECGAAGIVDGRNKLADVVVNESQAEWLFMVDSDMGFDADTVERLIAAADPALRPVVGGLCFAHKAAGKASMYGVRYVAQPTLYQFVELDDRIGFTPMFDYPRDEMVPVSGTGGACLLIHRAVLEAVQAKYGKTWFDTMTHPKGASFSEDLSFCVRVAGCDFPMYVHTGIKTTHDKGGVFLDEQFYDRQQASFKAFGDSPLVSA